MYLCIYNKHFTVYISCIDKFCFVKYRYLLWIVCIVQIKEFSLYVFSCICDFLNIYIYRVY